VSANGNEESTGENCHCYISVVNTITPYSCTIKLQYILLRDYCVCVCVCAACPTHRLNQSYELRPPWVQHLRYVPHRVRDGYNNKFTPTLLLHTCPITTEATRSFQPDSAVNRRCCFRVGLVAEMWPPRSPELNPSHFLLVRHVK